MTIVATPGQTEPTDLPHGVAGSRSLFEEQRTPSMGLVGTMPYRLA